MTYPFDTTTDDLTDAQIQVMIDNIGCHYKVRDVRAICMMPTPKAIIALARLMRDHPELFEEPVDPLRAAFEEWFVKETGGDPDLLDCELEWKAFKAGMATTKPTEPEWIDWYGGECPVPARSRCELRFRDGTTRIVNDPKGRYWRHSRDRNRPSDIVAYRVWP